MSEVRIMLIGEVRGEDAPGAQTVDTNARALAEALATLRRLAREPCTDADNNTGTLDAALDAVAEVRSYARRIEWPLRELRDAITTT